MLKNYLKMFLQGISMSLEESAKALEVLLDEKTSPMQIAAFLSMLKMKGESENELAGMALFLQQQGMRLQFPYPTLDIVGTGGDFAGTVNISTGSAILAASLGIPIAKHGNRSISSKAGSADLLEALGISIEVPFGLEKQVLDDVGIVFFFAPLYKPCLKKIGALRKELGIPTIFHLLGPLLNPVEPEYALIGVAQRKDLELMANTVRVLGNKKRALIFHGSGLDELTAIGPIDAYLVEGNEIRYFEIDPQRLGFKRCTLEELQGGDAALNAEILHKALLGKPSAVTDALILTAGTALWVFGKTHSLEEGVRSARKSAGEGKGAELLKKWQTYEI